MSGRAKVEINILLINKGFNASYAEDRKKV